MADPVFIVGVQRSGTTLLAAMLGAHSQMSCGPETHFFRAVSSYYPCPIRRLGAWPEGAVDFLYSIVHVGKPIPDNYGISKDEIKRYLQGSKPSISVLLSAITEVHMLKLGKSRWVEKTPDHLPHVGQIRRYFPNAPIIRILRDPRDVALSLVKVPWGPKTFLEAVLFWRDYDDRSAAFFDSDSRCYTVRYEDLVSSPEKELRGICAFIGETFEYAMLDPSRSIPDVNKTGEPWKEKAGMAPDKSRISVWQREITDEENRQAESFLSDRLEAYGYLRKEELQRRGCVFPLRTLAKLPDLLTSLLAYQGILWSGRRTRECNVQIYLGDPGGDGWLPAHSRYERLKRSLAIAVNIVKGRLCGQSVFWIYTTPYSGRSGYCNRAISLILKRYKTDRPISTLLSKSRENYWPYQNGGDD